MKDTLAMPVNDRLLRTPFVGVSLQPQPLVSVSMRHYTRKRRAGSKPPGPTDTICWFWEDEVRSKLMFRSPIKREEWITGEQRQLIIATLVHEGALFTTRKGFVPITEPVSGMSGWMVVPGDRRRRPYEFTGSEWVPAKRGDSL